MNARISILFKACIALLISMAIINKNLFLMAKTKPYNHCLTLSLKIIVLL